MEQVTTTTQRIRGSVLILGIFFVAVFVLFQVFLALYAGEITIWFKFGPVQTYSRAQDAASFYFWIIAGSGIATLLLALSVFAFILNWRRRSVFTGNLVGFVGYRNPSGFKPLWIGLALALGGFIAYVAIFSAA